MMLLLIAFSLWAGPALAGASAHETKSFVELARNIDWSCMKPQVVSACADPAPGVFIRYWEPTLVMETVKKPGDYVIREIGPIVGPLAQKASQIEMDLATRRWNVPMSSTSGWQSMGGSNVQFQEVHLYDFPLKLFEQAVLCPSLPNATLGVRYLSEADSVQWRTSSIEKNLPQTQAAARGLAYRVGNWGPLYPRSGFVVGANPAVSSGLDALRAISASSDFVPEGHIVESPLDFQMNMSTDQMQMLYPQKTMCMAPGTDARLWEPGRESREGTYVWLYWRYRQCCKPVVPIE